MSELKQAVEELEAALGRLEDSLDNMTDPHGRGRLMRAEAEALRKDRAQLAMDLDASRAREKELEALADEASRALGIAIAEVKAAMNTPTTTS